MTQRRKKGDEFTFTVEGYGRFPVDMLRYDACWPKSEGRDSTAMNGDHDSERRRVVLVTAREHSPTPGRWESFGWRYIGEGEQREMELPDFAGEPELSEADLKKRTMEIHATLGLIPAVKFYRAARWRGGTGRDPGLKDSIDLIRDEWAKERVV